MRIREIQIKNLRSIVDTGPISTPNLFALVGENNAGKSNTLIGLRAFLSGGAGGLKEDDFYDKDVAICIKATFGDLTQFEKNRWKKYLAQDQLILEKHIWCEPDENSGAVRIKSEYHGYESEPEEWYLSINAIIEREGNRPKWAEIAEEHGLPEYFFQDGKCNKSTYSKALVRYFEENEVAFGEPDLSATQALGLQSKTVASLPSFYFLPAITDYSDEIDKRQKSSTFRRLMGELSERILQNDPRISELQTALGKVQSLLNEVEEGPETRRIEALSSIEEQIASLLKELMPSVSKVKLSVQIEELKELFSGGVALTVDDGVETDVLAKGHGLQRCIVFSLLRTLINTERTAHDDEEAQPEKSIILGIEEPELYIHPQLSKLFYDVMRSFAETDQIFYTTHSPLFVDAFNYQEVGIVKKPDIETGTRINIAPPGLLDDLDDRKVFKGLARFNPSVSELFFAKFLLLVEGPGDLIAVTETLKKLGRITTRPEEIEYTVIVSGGKEAIPFLQLILNGFSIPYQVLHDTDISDDLDQSQKDTHQKNNDRISELAGSNPIHVFPHKLETTAGVDSTSIKDQYRATAHFSDHENITEALEEIVKEIFT